MRVEHEPLLPLRGAPFPPGTRVGGFLVFDGPGARTTVHFTALESFGLHQATTPGLLAADYLEALARALRGTPVEYVDDEKRPSINGCAQSDSD